MGNTHRRKAPTSGTRTPLSNGESNDTNNTNNHNNHHHHNKNGPTRARSRSQKSGGSGGSGGGSGSNKASPREKSRTRENSVYRSLNHAPSDPNNIQRCLDDFLQERKEVEQLAKVSHFSEETVMKLQEVFTFISSTNVDDMRIDIDEFAKALGLKHDCIILKVLFEKFNVTKSKAMNFREFLMALSTLSPEATFPEKVRFSFQLYDINRDGRIDASELKKLLAAALNDTGSEIKLSDSDMDTICENTLRNVDLDGNGSIDYDEYQAMVEKNPRLIQPFTINIKELLDHYDRATKQQCDSDYDSEDEDEVKSGKQFESPRSPFSGIGNGNGKKKEIKAPPMPSPPTHQKGDDLGFITAPVSCVSCTLKRPAIKAVPINDVENLF